MTDTRFDITRGQMGLLQSCQYVWGFHESAAEAWSFQLFIYQEVWQSKGCGRMVWTLVLKSCIPSSICGGWCRRTGTEEWCATAGQRRQGEGNVGVGVAGQRCENDQMLQRGRYVLTASSERGKIAFTLCLSLYRSSRRFHKIEYASHLVCLAAFQVDFDEFLCMKHLLNSIMNVFIEHLALLCRLILICDTLCMEVGTCCR